MRANANNGKADKPPNLGKRFYSQLHGRKQGWVYILDLRKGGNRGNAIREGARHYRGYIRISEWDKIRKETTDEQARITRVNETVRGKIMATAISRRTRQAASGW